jgi:hypothetical protein
LAFALTKSGNVQETHQWLWRKINSLAQISKIPLKRNVWKSYGAIFGILLGLVGVFDFSEHELDPHAAYFNFINMITLLFLISSYILNTPI